MKLPTASITESEVATDVAGRIASATFDLSFSDLSPGAVEGALRGVLDTLGVCAAAAGAARSDLQPIRRATEALSGSGTTPAFALESTVSLMDATFWMGALSHALDYDDVHDVAVVHPSAPIVSALVPLILDRKDCTGREFLTAVAAGQDVAVRLGLALRLSITEYGWLPSLPGAIAAAVSAAKLLELDARGIKNSIALAVQQSTGTVHASYGTGSAFRAIREGFNARAGLTAALLAQQGCGGGERILEGDFGYFSQYFGNDYDIDVLTNGLGTRLYGDSLGLKAWPCCAFSQLYLTALGHALESGRRIDAGSISRVEVLGRNGVLRNQCEPRAERVRPRQSIDAKFSLPFQIGKFLAHRKIVMSDFTPEGLEDSEAHELAELVEWRVDDSFVGPRVGFGPGVVDIYLTDGSVVRGRADHSFGSTNNPMSWRDVTAKFVDCVGASDMTRPLAAAEEFAESVRELPSRSSCRDLLSVFT